MWLARQCRQVARHHLGRLAVEGVAGPRFLDGSDLLLERHAALERVAGRMRGSAARLEVLHFLPLLVRQRGHLCQSLLRWRRAHFELEGFDVVVRLLVGALGDAVAQG